MLTGTVNARLEGVLRLTVRGPGGTLASDAVIDTGYTGTLTLPVAMATGIGLVSHRSGGARLADGSVRQFDLYIGEVEWGGTWRSVLISGVGNEPLVGVKLLDGHTLRMVVTPGGLVEITPNP